MGNNTAAFAHETDDEIDLTWIVVPIVLGSLLYMTMALFVWPYARPYMPVGFLLLCILIPPLFPFLVLFLLSTICLFPVRTRTSEIYIVAEGVPAAPATTRRPVAPSPRAQRPSVMRGSSV